MKIKNTSLNDRKYIVIVCFVVITSLFSIELDSLKAQDYLWPTDASHHLTSSFGESRSDHFHAGIDIKTWGREGYRVFATRDGYIWKVRISPFGYGKVIYQVLDTGEIVVYGHLQRFAPQLERIMHQEQKERQHYSVEKIFYPNALPVKKGDLIAYTGRTGIGYPHLHFEIRSDENTPINPLQKNFHIRDTIAPLPLQFAVIPMNIHSQVNGWMTPQVFSIQRLSNNSYHVKEPIQIWGQIGFAIDAYDQANQVNNKFSVYRISVYLDGAAIFKSNYRAFTYDQTRLIHLDRNFELANRTGKQFYNLYVEPENDLSFYQPFQPGQGILFTKDYAQQLVPDINQLVEETKSLPDDLDQFYLQEENKPYKLLHAGKHQLRIIVDDYYGNRSFVSVNLIANKKNKPEKQWPFAQDEIENQYLSDGNYDWYSLQQQDQWIPVQQVQQLFASTMSLEPDLSATLHSQQNHKDFSDNTIFKILGGSNNIADYPIFLTDHINWNDLPQFDLDVRVKFPYGVFSVTSASPITIPIDASIQNVKVGQKLFPVTVHDLYHSTISVPTKDIEDIPTTLRLYTMKNLNQKITLLDSVFYFKKISCDSSKTIISEDSTIKLNFPVHVSNQPLFVSIRVDSSAHIPSAHSEDSVSPMYHISPTDVPFLKQIDLAIAAPQHEENINQIGIYKPDVKRNRWNFVGNKFNGAEYRLEARVKSLGTFMLLRDSAPPQLRLLSPANGATITELKPKIVIQYDDDLSGIGSEDDFRVMLDGQFCIAELDPELQQIKYQPEWSLTEGVHAITIQIKDRADNKNKQTFQFTIRENK